MLESITDEEQEETKPENLEESEEEKVVSAWDTSVDNAVSEDEESDPEVVEESEKEVDEALRKLLHNWDTDECEDLNSDDDNYRCVDCDFGSSEEKEVIMHRMSVPHYAVELAEWVVCGKRFRSRRNVDEHQKNEHVVGLRFSPTGVF